MKSLLVAAVCTGVVAAGCHHRQGTDPGRSIDGFRFGAYATIVGPRADTLLVTATAENVSKRSLEDISSPCYQLNRLSVAAHAGSGTWDSKNWEISQLPVYHDATGRVIEGCLPMAFLTLIGPSGLQRYELRAPITRILGDSLQPGKYTITARIVINGREVGDLRAGEVELRPPST